MHGMYHVEERGLRVGEVELEGLDDGRSLPFWRGGNLGGSNSFR